MNELDTMKRAKMYLDKLSRGIDPITDTALPLDGALSNMRLSRCFAYVSGVLEQVIENGGTIGKRKAQKPPFTITTEQKARVRVIDEPIPLTGFVKQINAVTVLTCETQLTFAKVADGLEEMGFLEKAEASRTRVPTQTGVQLGISREERTNERGDAYLVNLFNRAAQQFVLDNLEDILEAAAQKKAAQKEQK